jgi:uncharacterized protein
MKLVALTFLISVVSSIFSGIAGGGGGFIITPYLIFIGLSPQQAIATGKMGGIGVTFGSLVAFRGKGLVRKKLLPPLMAITLAASLFAGWAIPKIDPIIFQKIIGATLIVLIPTLFINKKAFQPGSRTHRWLMVGYVLYACLSFAQAMIGTGLAMLLTMILMFLFGLTPLQANATKRVTQSVQSIIVFILLLAQGFVVLAQGTAILLGSLLGGHIGSNEAVKRGNKFVKIILALVMASSGMALLLMK